MAELRLLREAVDRTSHSEGRCLIISGEAGIGKTRLLRATEEYARSRGMRVLATACQAHDLQSAYVPWASWLRQFVESSPRSEVLSVLDDATAAAQRLLPELADQVWLYDPTCPPQLTENAAEFMPGMIRIFRRLDARAPVLLSIDDLGWADASTLELLRNLVEAISGRTTMVLGTFRDSHREENPALAVFLEALERNRLAGRIELDPLDRPAVGHLIREFLGVDTVSREFTRQIHDRSQGNPFFATELLESLANDGQLWATEAGWRREEIGALRLPTSIRATLERRLSQLPATDAEALRTASVLGLTFDFALLEAVSQAPGDELLRSLERALRGRLLREELDAGNRLTYRFGHPLIQEVLQIQVSEVRSRRTHLRAAQYLSGLGPDEGQAALIAHHFLRSDHPEEAFPYALKAGERASQLLATSEAISHLTTALSFAPADLDPLRRARLQAKLANQLSLDGEFARAKPLYQESTDFLAARGLDGEAGRLLVEWSSRGPPPRQSMELLQRARPLLERAGDAHAMIDWHLNWAESAIASLNGPEAVASSRAALELADRAGTPSDRLRALVVLAGNLPITRAEESVRLQEQARRLSEGLDPKVRWTSLRTDQVASLAVITLHFEGDLLRLLETAEEYIDRFEAHGQLWSAQMYGLNGRAWTHLLAGDLDRCEVLLGAWRTVNLQRQVPLAQFDENLYQGYVYLLRGDLESAERLFEVILLNSANCGDWEFRFWALVWKAEIRRVRGQLSEAQQLLEEGRRMARAAGPNIDQAWTGPEVLLRLLILRLEQGELERARGLVRELEAMAGFAKTDLFRAYVARGQGLLKEAEGDASAAVPLLEASNALWSRLGWKYQVAGGYEALGNCRERLGEHNRARAAWKEALSLLRPMRAQPDIDRITRRMA